MYKDFIKISKFHILLIAKFDYIGIWMMTSLAISQDKKKRKKNMDAIQSP
jgi:hypothetical protein